MSLTKVKKLLEYYEGGAIPVLSQHEVHPDVPIDSRENYLYFTLPVCINFQRNSPAMWAAALKTWEDESTRYLFFPEKLAVTPIEKVRDDLLKHRLGLQPNKHVLIWTTIARTLHEHYNDDPRDILKEAEGDAGKLIELLQVTHKKRFPYLSGPKLSNYWPYILSQYTDVELSSPQEISIIPDTHVLQGSVVLGIVAPGANSKQVEATWKELLKDTAINPSRVHPALWNWSRNKFEPKV
ncbi:MAG: hypothetical protein H6799_03725 [Candidatus Nomurabacteria bacterium]|nr:MAG: hypothetical protein H6799_03725 [Candidatus Nomurabacteria bacterium]HRV76326.1 hypothetical protein [Candidatus Saccharimonadales bacterium]